jgi:DNA-binding SARP family transcriptional activator
LIGNEKVIQLRDGRVELDPRYCWVDAYAFERLLEQAESNGSIHQIEKAISLYKGPFLGDTDELWAVPFKENLRSKFLRAVEKLGNLFERDEQCEKAIECYQRGLEADELGEGFYQRLMMCYGRSDRRAEALSVYHRCRKIMQSVLGVDPSDKTEAIYKRLMQNSDGKMNSTSKIYPLWDPDAHSE